MRRRVLNLTTITAIIAIGGACWWLTATMSADFYASATIATQWQHASFSTLFLMWGIMMAAMMLPTAAPFLRLFWQCCVFRKIAAHSHIAAAAGGYILLWLFFSLLAAGAHKIAAEWNALNSSMALADPTARAALFAAAAAYQFTPLKFACLRGCRPPPLFLILHWQTGVGGAFRLGLKNGAYCVGCCWALMLLLFAGGVMDFRWIVGLTLLVLAEKILPPHPIVARSFGVGLLALAVVELL